MIHMMHMHLLKRYNILLMQLKGLFLVISKSFFFFMNTEKLYKAGHANTAKQRKDTIIAMVE